jgi:hypothetical protein
MISDDLESDMMYDEWEIHSIGKKGKKGKTLR